MWQPYGKSLVLLFDEQQFLKQIKDISGDGKDYRITCNEEQSAKGRTIKVLEGVEAHIQEDELF